MSNFIYKKNKVSLIKRIRIKENRDLKMGIRLNRNERVENFEKGILSKIFKSSKDYDLGKYPDQSKIYKVLSKFVGVNEENLIISSGIDGSIKSIFEIFTDQNDQVAVLSPTYAMYDVYSTVFKTKIIKIGYKNFKLNREKLFQVIKKRKIKILFLPNPNQPIEDNISLKEMKKICKECKKKKILLVVDEAYHMFGSQTSISLCKKYENILVLRTLSKSFGLPSIRFGYAIGNKKIVQILNSYRLSYESNYLTDSVVNYFIKNISLVKGYIKKINKGRDYFKKELKKMNFDVIGGESNFLLIDFKNNLIKEKILKNFSTNKIYVKFNYKGDLSSCILVTCGTVDTMKKILKIIRSTLTK